MGYVLDIKLDDSTLEELKAEKYSLLVFKASGSNAEKGVVPTVWLKIHEFSSEVNIKWDDKLNGYYSQSTIGEGDTVRISTAQSMVPGDEITLEADGASKWLEHSDGNREYTLASENKNPGWACGLETPAKVGSKSNAGGVICASPVHSTTTVKFTPVEKLLIFFSSNTIVQGEVVVTTSTESLLLTFKSDAERSSISTGFNFTTGWVESRFAKLFKPNADIARVLNSSDEA